MRQRTNTTLPRSSTATDFLKYSPFGEILGISELPSSLGPSHAIAAGLKGNSKPPNMMTNIRHMIDLLGTSFPMRAQGALVLDPPCNRCTILEVRRAVRADERCECLVGHRGVTTLRRAGGPDSWDKRRM